MRYRPRLPFTAVAMLAMTSAFAIEPTVQTSLGLHLPEYIGPLEYTAERGLPEEHAGATFSYRSVGLSLDVYVYDFGSGGLADGTDSAELLRREDERMAGAEPLRESIVPLDADGQLAAREAVFDVPLEHFDTGVGYRWLTAAHGLLFDVRFDVQKGFEEDGAISRGEILAALGRAIPESSEDIDRARARPRPADETSVAILWDPGTPEVERPLWMTYLYTRAAHVAKEYEGNPVPPGVRTASYEEEVRARLVTVNVFRSLRAAHPELASIYFSDLDRVVEAGFLREYVWALLHDASWTRQPSGLRTEAFERWRSSHLADHVAVTRGRIAFRLATR